MYHNRVQYIVNPFITCQVTKKLKQAISTHEWAPCQLTVCFEFQSRSEKSKIHKSCDFQNSLIPTKLDTFKIVNTFSP